MERFQKPREQREIVKFKLPLNEDDSGQFLGYVMDISPHGIKLLGLGPLLKHEMDMELALPREVQGHEALKLHGDRRWIRFLYGGRWLAGFRIQERDCDFGTLAEIIASPDFRAA